MGDAATLGGENRFVKTPTLPGLFEREVVAVVDFDGETYNRARDHSRLDAQLFRVRSAMWDQQWRTLNGVSLITGDEPQSISARLRDLRKPKFGGFTVQRRYVKRGLHEYRLVRK